MITVTGIGPGAEDLMIGKVAQEVQAAELVIGSKRQLDLFDLPSDKQMVLPKLMKLKEFLLEHTDMKIVLLASGDPYLYGIANWIKKEITNQEVVVVPGISSIQYLFNRVGIPMNDSYLTSSHGRTPDFDFLLQHKTICMVTDGKIGPYEIAQEIKQRQQHRLIFIGENLSYPDELITKTNETEIQNRKYQMNVVLITDER
ncbi:cobalt-precorrin-7 (C(5))-methyltransferase [Companilactobacillus sp.]|jgi:cobalt-precorrin-7 (C5)-methyltransferase|uniref:cobalt-precorrin-7 (C(5))-methyltransferase n=1 Tax=Companilactobacillus sp. TaxID=2767905 RepID=UPI0025BA5023|nr:cobalt-precorrin-7 (C(5))-methyltransferase [Companilactobacillus sp.]MCH4008626.1 cobalt-precorrin-7 (C(5))-methyltransferase [Companilactobacillus sp.]MCH4051195.1 cobalt-precorrin-7 (C(5))-methyltransferase [Companilactobacillus sp.]MCH4076569.1 cobalt-precorrin-7 (C(5))-methyltransferase [Companilactobacillus sp.]MCH4125144.1 cobalt-precorrin-7 (C(5))-methyltransferase [Companilactobacillus sp.]MCH4131684.1 cobalt-precorrin-7 (C(5))-methyltransferase [Companilactobacillus sp.]